jgi:ATP-binding cassette subfamily B protein
MSKTKKIKTQGTTLTKILRYIRHYLGYVIASLLLAILIVVLTLYVPILIGKTIDGIVYGKVDFKMIAQTIMVILIMVGITALAQWVMNTINNKMTYHIVRDIRKDAFEKIEKLPLSYFDRHSTGEIVSRVISDVDTFADGLLLGFTQVFTSAITILGTLLFMLSLSKSITLVVVLVTPLSLFAASIIAKHTYSMFKLQSETRAQQTSLIDEMIGNEKVVKAYGHEEQALKDFDEINERLKTYSLRAIFYSSITNPATRFVNGIVYALVALSGAYAVLNGSMSVGILSSFLSYANQYTKPFNEISGVITELQNALACAARIFELIEEEPQKEESAQAIQLNNAKGEVACVDVAFSYTKEKPLIKQFNLAVKPGQSIAIVGPTGCGKTTLINLLMRFYDVNEGSIQVDSMDVRDLTRHSLRTNFGMVLQDTWLKKGTIRENIILGKPDATEEEIITAAKAAHAHSFIRRLPKGYDTMISEEGGMLSQGQKQLLSITRVMICLPPMLILDEATSSIDTRTEKKIQSAFERLMEGRTSFIVAHRLSTIQKADLILVMKEGQVIEQGTHEELLEKQGFYTNLYNSQFTVANEAG